MKDFKGFGQSPARVPNDREITKLIAAIQDRNPEDLDNHRFHLVQKYGHEVMAQWFVEELGGHCPTGEDFEWYMRNLFGDPGYEEWLARGNEIIARLLLRGGLVPGEDFSVVNGHLAFSPRAIETMLSLAPPERQEYLYSLLKPLPNNDPIAVLEEHLGVPFVANLLTTFEQRLSLSDAELAGWVTAAAPSVEEATHIEVFPLLLERLHAKAPHRLETVLERLETDDFQVPEPETGCHPMLDVAIAADCDRKEIDGQIYLSKAGLRRLGLVWRGERSVYELLAVLEKNR